MYNVLIGESDKDLRLALRMLFQRAGHQVTVVADCGTVVRTAATTSPDLVLLNLPGPVGLDTCRVLRAAPRTAGTPIILLSPALYPDASAAAGAGADDYVTKPFDNADLLNRSRILLVRRPRTLRSGPSRSGDGRAQV
jgi:DNA-binding response OmpR family regulator